jgi:6-pyruvoyl-tetrahydropterin synthase
MKYNKLLKYFKTQEQFDTQSIYVKEGSMEDTFIDQNGEEQWGEPDIYPEHICFIEDTKTIFTHNTKYVCLPSDSGNCKKTTVLDILKFYNDTTKTFDESYINDNGDEVLLSDENGYLLATDILQEMINNEIVFAGVANKHNTSINNLQNDLSNLTTVSDEHTTYISDLTTTVENHGTYISYLGIVVDQNKDNICAILEQTKSSLYYNCNDYMKVDYRGTTYYSTNDNKYMYTDDWIMQHMYFDDELTTFIPGLPYQDPFKAIVTFKMPLIFSGGWSHQQLVMCQDFIWGDGQDDHGVMCPKWYDFGGMQWGGWNHSSVLNYNVVKYTTEYPLLYTNENIDISFNISSNTNTDYFLTVFVYPLIRVKDAEGHVYSPLLIGAMDNTKATINTKYTWMENTNHVSILERSIANPNYKENITNFYIEHIKQINKTFFGNDGITLPATANNLNSTRFQSFRGSNASNEGKVVQLDSVLKQYVNNRDTIELLTIDSDGYTISCGKSNNYTDLLTNYYSYTEFVKGKIHDNIKNKYPWLF